MAEDLKVKPTQFGPWKTVATPKKIQKLDRRGLSHLLGALRASNANIRDLEDYRTGEEVEITAAEEVTEGLVAGEDLGSSLLAERGRAFTPGGLTEERRQALLVNPFETWNQALTDPEMYTDENAALRRAMQEASYEGFGEALEDVDYQQQKRKEEIDHFNRLLFELAKRVETENRQKARNR